MGIKNLHKFLRKHCPEVYVKKHLSEYAFKKIAIDISVYLFMYKVIFGERWLDAFINLICCLRRNEIHCVFIYDGKSPPEKDIEKKRRRDTRGKQDEKNKLIEKAIAEYYKTGEIGDILQDIKTSPKSKRLLVNTFDIKACERYLKKKQSQVVNLKQEDFANSKYLFSIMGIPYYVSSSEGETMCAHLELNGKVYGVLSEDTDILAYGTGVFITKINTSADTVVEIRVENILKALKLTQEQFTDFCIMCGTDYNNNMYKVGPEKSYKLIKEYGSLNDMIGCDLATLNYKRGRELFAKKDMQELKVPYCKQLACDKVQDFLFTNNCRIAIETIRKAFKTRKLEFI